MKIAVLTSFDAENIHEWSGTIYYIIQYLKQNHTLYFIGRNFTSQAESFTRNNFSIRKYDVDYLQVLGKVCSEKINQLPDCDLVFFCDLALSAFLKVSLPLVHFSDASCHTMHSFRTDISHAQKRKIKEIEYKTLQKYNSIIYPSEWIANDTKNNFQIEQWKISVIEFGANIPHPESYQTEIETTICHIVFIGRHWKNKGGDIAFKTIRHLQKQGFPCKMTFIGCTPPPNESLPENTKIIPFLDKSKPEELERLCSILYEAHFLLLPTRFDAFGIVFAEASAYGVPSIATNVGGTSQAIREGKNGFLLPLEAGAEEYANKIKEVFADKESYYQLRRTSRKEYETRLNWDVWLKRVNKVFEETIAKYNKT